MPRGSAAGMVPTEVGTGRGLDPVGTLAEVDLVQVLGEDLVLRPLTLEVIGERRLSQLLEHGPALLCAKGVLDELLGDGGGALLRARVEDVLDHRPRDPLVVDAVMLVEALVLDRHRGLLHRRSDVVGADQDAAAIVGEGRDPGAVDVVEDRVLGVGELGAVLELRQVAGDGHHDPEDPGDEGEEGEAEEDEREAKLLELRASPRGLGARRGRGPLRGPPGRPAAV